MTQQEEIAMTTEELMEVILGRSVRRIISEEEKREYMKKSFTIQMMSEYQYRNNLEAIQKLYESAGFKDNRKLAEKLKTDRRIYGRPYDNMYMDIIYTLADEIVKNDTLAEKYISMFSETYNIDVHAIVKKLSIDYIREQMGREKIKDMRSAVTEMVLGHFGILNSFPLAEEQFLLFAMLYLLPYEQVAFPIKCINDGYENDLKPLIAADILDENYNRQLSEKMDWCDSFWGSGIYREYINKRISELAEAYGMDVNGLVAMIEDIFSMEGKVKEHHLRAINIFRRHHLLFSWREDTLFNEDKTGRYKPNVSGIMEDYYKCYAFNKWTEENPSSITKADILQDTKTDNAERDMNSIIEMCEMDVVCQMYQDLLKEYYMNFSFELLSSERVREKYRKQLEKAEKEVSVQHSRYQNLLREIENASMENQRLRETIKNQEKYIEELKKKGCCSEDIS